MGDTIYLKTGQFSSSSFKKTKSDLKQAADALNSLDYYGALWNATYTCNGVSQRIFSAAYIEEANALAALVDKLRDKLNNYSKLLQSGPEELQDTDEGFKGTYSSGWDRFWHSVGSGISSAYSSTVGFYVSLFKKGGQKTGGKTVIEADDKETVTDDKPIEKKQSIIDQDSVDNYTNESGSKNDVQRGRIRWVNQISNYEKNGWYSDNGKLDCYPPIQCNSACASMALSYMGIDRSPASLVGPDDMDPASSGTCYKTWTTESGETIQLENHALQCNMEDIKKKTEAFSNDGGKGEVSPVLIRYSYPGENASSADSNGHWLIIVGDNGDGTYQVIGPATESERITTVKIDDNGNISGDGISNRGGVIQRYAQYSRK